MPAVNDLARGLATAIPDDPGWIDIRGMLLSPHVEISGGDSVDSGFVVRVVSGAVSSVGVVGRPPAAAIRDAVAHLTAMTPVICQADAAPYVRRVLAGWTEELAIVHTLEGAGLKACATGEGRRGAGLKPCATGEAHSTGEAYGTGEGSGVRLLRSNEAATLAHLPPGLRHEMTGALALGPLAATFVDDRPVSFCYPVWQTEAWWDVSIDTLEPYRRRGLAVAAMRLMTAEMQKTGRAPIWSTLASNTPSLRLAAKLSFTPVDSVIVSSRDGRWTLLSGGFTGSVNDSTPSVR